MTETHGSFRAPVDHEKTFAPCSHFPRSGTLQPPIPTGADTGFSEGGGGGGGGDGHKGGGGVDRG